tara:strand:+ start:2161 stop:2397 length:237 start_codon:yes stop_codon:yes gene_type:complete
MKAKDIKIGQRVIVSPLDQTALIVGHPEYYTPRAQLVRVKFENSTRYEHKINHQLTLLPTESQYPTHGGLYVKPDGDF